MFPYNLNGVPVNDPMLPLYPMADPDLHLLPKELREVLGNQQDETSAADLRTEDEE